ncbi:MAG: YggS family pyridoxal phosphate-dependent enzyme [Pseudomonadota bacterium]|nr:YggS family pyridoxal phosphate-dependent enzyme [Pseudomonadota bacterium]
MTQSIVENTHRLRRHIAVLATQAPPTSGGRAAQLLAVSKGQPVDAIRAAHAAGQLHFGESRVDEALKKQETLADLRLCWHFIGPIQSNKTRRIAAHFDWVHSVDSLRVAERLSAQRPATAPPLRVLLQVNLDSEPQKRGVAPTGLATLAGAVTELPHLQLCGLMALPERRPVADHRREPFDRLRGLAEQLQQLGLPAKLLSMGMSDDMEAAIAAGAHWVRIGRALFGPPHGQPTPGPSHPKEVLHAPR